MGTISIIAGIISLIVTILIIVKICKIANNTSEIKDLLYNIQQNSNQSQSQKQQRKEVSSIDENGNEKTIFQMMQEQNENKESEKSLYEQQQEFWQ